MKNLSLQNIAMACNGQLFCNSSDQNKEVSEIVTDNRKVTEESLFIAITGKRVDGHDFINAAFDSGALCVISEKEFMVEKPYILVSNSLQAIKDIAKFYISGLDIKVVGITGSVGKTSTKEMIYSVLSEKYSVLKTEGNFNNELGLPLTIFRLREQHQIAVLEMGISDFGEMKRLSEICKPDVAVITNIGLCHLENLKSRDGILKAKTEMFENLKKGAKIVLNGDDDKLSSIQKFNEIIPEFYHVKNVAHANIYADSIVNDGIKGINCSLHYHGSNIPVKINIPGDHMVYNALAALTVGKIFHLSDEDIKNGIEKIMPVKGRNNILDIKGLTVIDDCYNANPISMKASIDVLEYANTRKVAILGDMFELGENENQLHESIGKYLLSKNIDIIVFVGSLMNYAYLNLLHSETDKKLYYFETMDLLFTEIERIVQPNDTILVKASNGMKFTKIVDYFKNTYKGDSI